jgi:ethanolamine transporter EutH
VSSTLFLQIFAAADYYTTNKTLMEQVPPVFVDIILDPYLFNVFPRSLVPTAVYIVLLAIGSWFLSKHISQWFQDFAQTSIDPEKKDS